MATEIKVQMTPQGLLIPREALEGWEYIELEMVYEQRGIIIRPKTVTAPAQAQMRQELRESGMVYEMKQPTIATENTVEITSQGVFIPRTMIEDWQEIEVIAEPQRIIIQSKEIYLTEYQRTLQVLEACGYSLPSGHLPAGYVPLSAEEKEELGRAFSVGKPLSQLVIEEREGR